MTISKAPAVPRGGPLGDTRRVGGMARQPGGIAGRPGGISGCNARRPAGTRAATRPRVGDVVTRSAEDMMGQLELGGMVLAADGFPVNVVTMAEPTWELNEWRREYRERFRIKTITVGSDKFAFVEIIQALRRNELVAMLVDRPYLNSGVPVKFFGRSTLFSSAAVRIWQSTQTSVIPAFVVQLRPGHYGCYAYPPIDMTPDRALEENSQRIANVFQAIIREFPEQWYNFVPIWHD